MLCTDIITEVYAEKEFSMKCFLCRHRCTYKPIFDWHVEHSNVNNVVPKVLKTKVKTRVIWSGLFC